MAATLALEELGLPASEREARTNIATAIGKAADRLGNTPAVCRKCYIHPDVLDAYLDGGLEARSGFRTSLKVARLTSDEAALLSLLKRRASRKTEQKRAA